MIKYALPFIFLALPLSAEIKSKKNYEVKQSTYTINKSTQTTKNEKTAEKKSEKLIDENDVTEYGYTKSNSKKDKTKEFYIFGANTSLNPEAYNREIEKVSVGKGFGNTQTFGAGYSRNDACLELSKNEQKVDAIKQEIATGKNIVYGYNYLALTNIDLILRHGFPITKTTDLEVAIGPTLTQVYLESDNGDEKINSVTSVYGTKASLSLCQQLAKYFIRAEIAQRTRTSGKLDISGLEAKICVGTRK